MNPYEGIGRELNCEAMQEARKKWDAVAKPLHGLGKLEDILVRIAGIQGTADIRLDRRALLVFCADNGVTAQGVTQTDSHVTSIVADNIADGKASVSRMCAKCDIDVYAVDIGIKDETHSEHLIRRTVSKGTKDFAKEPAMSIEEVLKAVETGISLIKEYKDKGYTLFATGEMGIGNTTTASAVTAALLGLSAEEAVGRGAGLSNEGLLKKKKVVAEAIERWQLRESSALEVLVHVGGLDIAGMAGAFIGGSMYGVPVVVDGMISAAAALVAARLCPLSVNCMIASHISREPAMCAIMEELALFPVIDGNLALGEGTGAALLFPMLDMAESVYRSNETFDKIQIESYQNYDEEE